MKKISKTKVLLLAMAATFATLKSQACSRITYTGADDLVITGRSMDWMEDMKTDLWAFPAGIHRSGNAEDPNSVQWTSKYGSVIASVYNSGSADGINTAGLDANLLYLSGSNYGRPKESRKNLSMANWVQYVLDNYATVDEVVKDFGQDKLNMIVPSAHNGQVMDLHLSITDSSGDNAIFEYINGKLIVHHSKQYKVMTNEPAFDKQLALNEYWQNLNGKFLPGTEEPADRFVRASFYVNNAPKIKDTRQALAQVFSIMHNVSVPYGSINPQRPNLAPTLWLTVADLKTKTYFFEETNSPNVFWVNINQLNLKPGAPVKKLSLAGGEVYSGEVSKYFKNSAPYVTPQIMAR